MLHRPWLHAALQPTSTSYTSQQCMGDASKPRQQVIYKQVHYSHAKTKVESCTRGCITRPSNTQCAWEQAHLLCPWSYNPYKSNVQKVNTHAETRFEHQNKQVPMCTYLYMDAQYTCLSLPGATWPDRATSNSYNMGSESPRAVMVNAVSSYSGSKLAWSRHTQQHMPLVRAVTG